MKKGVNCAASGAARLYGGFQKGDPVSVSDYGDRIFISIMNQYTPIGEFLESPELNRRVSRREYDRVVDFALELGVENGFIQEGETAEESFIPEFDGEGL